MNASSKIKAVSAEHLKKLLENWKTINEPAYRKYYSDIHSLMNNEMLLKKWVKGKWISTKSFFLINGEMLEDRIMVCILCVVSVIW